jgi:hypothetical protein
MIAIFSRINSRGNCTSLLCLLHEIGCCGVVTKIINDDICLLLYLFFYFMATPIELIFKGVSKSNTYILIDITHDCLPYYKW